MHFSIFAVAVLKIDPSFISPYPNHNWLESFKTPSFQVSQPSKKDMFDKSFPAHHIDEILSIILISQSFKWNPDQCPAPPRNTLIFVQFSRSENRPIAMRLAQLYNRTTRRMGSRPW